MTATKPTPRPARKQKKTGAAQNTRRPSVVAYEEGDLRVPRNSRQIIATPSTAAFAALLPDLPGIDETLVPAVDETTRRYADDDVVRAYRLIRASNIVPYLDDRFGKMKDRSGRPCALSGTAILVALYLAAVSGDPLLLTTVRDTLYVGISDAMRRLLDVAPNPRPEKISNRRRWERARYANVRRAFHRLLASIDPQVHHGNRVRTWEEGEALKKGLSEEVQLERMAALTWVVNRLLETVYLQVPEPIRARRRHYGEDTCIDASPMPLWARGRGVDNPIMSADPSGGFYVRKGDHSDPAEHVPYKRSNDVRTWALDLHILVAADATTDDRVYFPAVPYRMTADRPAFDADGAARRMFATLGDGNHVPGYLAGDLLYTALIPGKFPAPARDAGFDLVLGYGKDHHGKQGGHASGIKLVDGTYYAPCMPDKFHNLVERFRNKEIDQQQFATLNTQRIRYEMRTKQAATPTTLERLRCPAAGDNPTAMCALKPSSLKTRKTTQKDGTKADVRPTINHKIVLTDGTPPTVCAQDAVSIAKTDGERYRQTLRYGTPEHAAIYNRLRQSQEGLHGSAKDEAKEALSRPGRRRVRGLAPQHLFASLLLAGVSTRRIVTFLKMCVKDVEGNAYVPRVIRTGIHATTNLPPGMQGMTPEPPDE